MFDVLGKGMNYLFGRSMHKQKIFLGSSLNFLERERAIDPNYFDYIRLATLELVSHEIRQKSLEGCVAELGVYQGRFARHINAFFPERTLYLFDTFEGFDKRDIESERKQGLSSGGQDFSDTSVEAVLKRMPHPEKCIPVRGFFPESATEVRATFVLASIDTDLFEPVYHGLEYFYPRLVPGGYLFVHDFNNDHYKGSRRAVMQFCAEKGLNYLPIPDSGGTAILMK